MPLPKKMPKGRTSQSKDVGRIFANRYRVDKRLGSGSFGTVFLVEDMRSKGEWKVLKEIYVGELQPDETVDAMREARLLSNLNHSNIVKFLDSFIDGEFFCIVTEYCEGGDLDDKIRAWKKAGKTFDESLVLAWFIQLLMAVQYMHDKRILHRDLKTRNIFLKNNIIKLGDFGISRILMGTSDMATTFTGTPYYMSPEVLKHEGYKYKSDVWSLGVVLYELCNLEHAFQGQSLMGVMYKIVEGEIPKISSKYSQQLHDLFRRMLDKDPAERPSAAEIIRSEFIATQMAKLKLQMHDRLNVSTSGSRSLNDSRKQKKSKSKLKPKLYQEPDNRPMTPVDRMKLRKQQRADEEAERLKMFMASQAAENQARYSQHKKKQNRVSLPWVEEHPDVFNDQAFTVPAADSSRSSPPCYSGAAASPEPTDYDSGHADSDDEDLNDQLTLTNVSEIPEDAHMAETFYSQFEDEFEDSEEDDDDEDEEDDFSALMDHMQGALEQSASGVDRTLSDDSIGEGLTDTLKQRRIEALRAECEKLLGSQAFHRAYDYLKKVRFGDEMKDEDSIMDALSKIVDKPRDCFLVDQLLFMEKQAEIAAMT